MKKVLLINEQYPFPENSGAHQRTMLFARYFKQHADVDLVYCQKTGEVHKGDDTFRSEKYIPRQDFPNSRMDHAVHMSEGFPWCVRIRHSRTYKKILFSMIEKEAYDVIFIRYPFNAQYFLKEPVKLREKVIVDFDDVLSGPLYSLVYSIPNKKILKKWLDYQLTVYYEKNCCRKLGRVLFCSQHNIKKNLYKKYKNIHIVPNVVNLSYFTSYNFGDGFSMDNTFLFVGALDWAANVEGLDWFIKSVYKPFQKKNKNSKLLVVGKNPKEAVRQLIRQTETAELYANVPDVRPYYAKSRFVVVPLLSGSGTRIKILEAALTERPVISTSVGAEGLGFLENKDILIFKDLDSFTQNIELLYNKEIYAEISKNAKQKTTKEYL